MQKHLVLATLALAVSFAGGAAAEDDPHAKHRAMMKQPSESVPEAADIDLRDRTLVNQAGEDVRFVSDVIGEKIVVMDFVYTTCTTICPVLTALFSQVQGKLGDRLGDEVVLVSVTVDPARDTPERLQAYSSKHGARDGWVWLTGPKPTVDDVLTGVGAYSVNFEDHPSMVLIGDGRTGEWQRLFGFPSPDRIMSVVDKLQKARDAGG